MNQEIKLIECPRDAMQGWEQWIPTEQKIDYINSLLRVGFDTIDFGSFVSKKMIPQLSDTKEVLASLDLSSSKSKLLAIIANVRGAEEACVFEQIDYLGFPFSVSEEFQKRNTNSTIEESLVTIREIRNICTKSNKKPVVYISMGFGNPYGEPWNTEVVIKWVKKLSEEGISIIALSDTIGVSTPENISYLFNGLIPEFPQIEFGAHLHSDPNSWREKVIAAKNSGCLRFDSAIKGIGGCPMATNELVGNLATENLIDFFGGLGSLNLNESAWQNSMLKANEIFH